MRSLLRRPLGDLDLAPRPMDVEDDEEIDGAVAAVLVINLCAGIAAIAQKR